ncbi:hypothetical protein Droror1_Dr00016325 [Drosera rotundifolia]
MKGVKLKDLYYLVGTTVAKEGTAAILTENEPPQDDDFCGGDSSGSHSKDSIVAPEVAATEKVIANAMEGLGDNKDVEAPMKAHGAAQDALLWHYRDIYRNISRDSDGDEKTEESVVQSYGLSWIQGLRY